MSQSKGSKLSSQYLSTTLSGSLDQTGRSKQGRRRFLVIATSAIGAVGASLAAWPFLASWRPSAKARAVGGPVKVNVSLLEPGQQLTVVWRGKPVWVLRRTAAMLERLGHDQWIDKLSDPDSATETQQPPYARNATRSIRPDIFVTVGICTHLGCVPTFRPDVAPADLGEEWMGGYFCPCHKSKFDLAGRVFKYVPAPTNLVVPPYRFLDSDTVEIGIDSA